MNVRALCLDRIDQRNLPLSATYAWNHDGAGVRTYILDTGIRTSHNEFGTGCTEKLLHMPLSVALSVPPVISRHTGLSYPAHRAVRQ